MNNFLMENSTELNAAKINILLRSEFRYLILHNIKRTIDSNIPQIKFGNKYFSINFNIIHNYATNMSANKPSKFFPYIGVNGSMKTK